MRDPNPRVAGQGIERLRAAGIEVAVGLMESAAREINRGFISRMERGRPHVTLKLGASLDGRTAMASGESQWITSEAARADVQRLRAEAGAVMTGAGTVLADDPRLTLRGEPAPARMPDRVVLDTHGRVPVGAKVWNADGARRFWLRAAQGATPEGVIALAVATGADGSIDLEAALAALAAQEVNSVLVECGATLAGALLREGLVDELICYLAPSLLGDGARGMASLPGVDALDQQVKLKFTDVRQIGPDLRLTAVPMIAV